MLTQDYESLLTQLKNGHLSPADLTGEQFQSIIFCKLLEKCIGDTDFEYELLDDYRGVVDFVVRVKPRRHSQFDIEDPLHMFECKYYRRTLELSTIAKLLIAGVRFQPSSLNVVSNTSLQPQVYDYARLLFNGLGNQTAMFQRTFFRHFKTSDLLDWKIDASFLDESFTAVQDGKGGKLGDISWEIIESRPFAERLLTDSLATKKEITLDCQWIYQIRVSLLTYARPEKIRFWVETSLNSILLSELKSDCVEFESGRFHMRFSQTLDLSTIKQRSIENLILHFKYGSKEHRVSTIPISIQPPFDYNASFPEIHADKAINYCESLKHRSGPRLMFLSGEAGVGKTHLCEVIAETMQKAGDFQSHRFSIDTFEDSGLLNTIFVSLCTPALSRGNPGKEWRQLALNIFEALTTSNELDQKAVDVRTMERADLLLPVLAEFLANTGPRLLVLRDLHLVTEKAAREITELITRLDDLDWGDIYCILEYRSSDYEANKHWTKLRLDLQSRVNKSEHRYISPLTLPGLSEFLEAAFVQISDELKLIVWNCSGGLPLFFFNFFDLLVREGVIKPVEDGRWSIEKPSAFGRFVKTELRSDGILEERLRNISWNETVLPQSFQKCPLALISVIAVAENSERVGRLMDLLGLDNTIVYPIRRLLIQQKLIKQSDDPYLFVFQHDLLRKIAIEIGRNDQIAVSVIANLVEKFDETNADILALELFADLAIWGGFREDAIKFLNFAYERSRGGSNFTLLTRLLTKLCENILPDAFSSEKNYVNYLSCRSALAWATWNTGSLLEARLEYSQLHSDSLFGIDKVIDVPTARSYAADAERRKAGIDLELDDLSQFVSSSRNALELNGNSVVVNSTMNRLILCCALYSFPEDGLEFARMSLKYLGPPDIESAGAVICSDIGALFLSTMPEAALDLYLHALTFECDDRQQIHNELNVLISEARRDGRIIAISDFESWRRRLSENELRGMLVRFEMFQAAMLLRSGNIDDSKRLFSRAETSIGIYRYEHQLLPLWNDTMVSALLEGDYERAYRIQQRIVDKIKRICGERAVREADLQALLPIAKNQTERFSHLSPLELPLPSTTPAYSGHFPNILLNLERLAHLNRAVDANLKNEISRLWPKDLSHSQCSLSFDNIHSGSSIKVDGVNVLLCSQ